MAFNSGYKRRHFTVKSSDSDSDIPLYKKERITRAKKVTKNLQTFCDNDSSTQENIPVTRRSNAFNCNRSIRRGAVYRTRIVSTSSESDTTSVDNGKVTGGKQVRRKKNNVNIVQISESSRDSADSLIQNKNTRLESSSVNKQNNDGQNNKKNNDKQNNEEQNNDKQNNEEQNNKKNNNKQNNNKQNNNKQSNKQSNNKQNNNKDSESEFIDCSQVVENRSEESRDEELNIIASTPIGDSRVIEKQKRHTSTNFKPQVTKIMEEMKCKFSRFISQISRLQQRYFKQETVTLEDAKDIIFILTCIISRLKEEFTEHQHKLMDFCFQSSMKHNSKRTLSNIQDKQFLNDNHLQVQSLIHNSPDSWNASSSNNNESVFSENSYVEETLQATKSPINNLQSSNKDLVLHKDNKKSNTKSALDSNNHLSVQTNENNILLQNSKSALSIPNNTTKSNDRGNIEGSTKDTSKQKVSPKTSTFSFRQPVKMTQSVSKNRFNLVDDSSQSASSDVDSTCSTLNLFSSYKVAKQHNNRTASCTNEYGKKAKNDVLDKITLNSREVDTQSLVSSCENIFSDKDSTKRSGKEKLPASNNGSQTNSLYRIHSLDTMIYPHQTDNEDSQRKSIHNLNSEETLIFPHRTSMNAKNCSFVTKKKIFRIDSDDLIYEPDFEYSDSNENNLNKKYRSKYLVDKKLRMDCRVLIERCNL
ncbi:uncharacterized protein LOC100877368 isoform X1 [Megachile rotundata]|uniref:uncharacterized protein LOC100877368 isoform X1 n=1 Tax=Megachile rotundata TaxID=143995 RepID=UPI003FD18573